ncbi:uncharacterized protein [Nicotiana tomentosiformis]|uniref:uncharacterized protein n=1 Tax=Nicotiana tomentosiformis TaxID=4098 RepID=UPI00388C4E84
MDPDEGGKLAMAYLLLDMCYLGNVIDGVKRAKHGEGPSGANGDPTVYMRTYNEKLLGVGKNEQIHMKLFMQSLTRDALSWYISKNPKKWANWVSMASDFVDRFRFNTENMPDIFYIQNLKKKPTETFCDYATRWRSEAAEVRPPIEEEQMNKFFVRA